MSPTCLHVRTLRGLYQVWGETEFSGFLIRKHGNHNHPRCIMDGWYQGLQHELQKHNPKENNLYSHLLQRDLFPLQSRGPSSLSKTLTHLQRNHINVRKVVWIQFPFIFSPFTRTLQTLFSEGGGLDLSEVIAGQRLLNLSLFLHLTRCLMPIWLRGKHIIFKVRWGRHCLMPFITTAQLA